MLGVLGLRKGKPSFCLGGLKLRGLCTCSSGIVHMPNLKRAHAQLEACACSTGSVHMLNWNMRMLKVEVCVCSTGMHVLSDT